MNIVVFAIPVLLFGFICFMYGRWTYFKRVHPMVMAHIRLASHLNKVINDRDPLLKPLHDVSGYEVQYLITAKAVEDLKSLLWEAGDELGKLQEVKRA